jgi:hypothetical protein
MLPEAVSPGEWVVQIVKEVFYLLCKAIFSQKIMVKSTQKSLCLRG